MNKRALKDLPLQEFTLRKYEPPSTSNYRELAKKFLLSIGLLQPGESRDIIVDIFILLLQARDQRELLDLDTIKTMLAGKIGASDPNIRRQLRRLRALKLVEKLPNGYRIAEFGALQPIIENYIIQFIINPSIERIKEYARKLDHSTQNNSTRVD